MSFYSLRHKNLSSMGMYKAPLHNTLEGVGPSIIDILVYQGRLHSTRNTFKPPNIAFNFFHEHMQ